MNMIENDLLQETPADMAFLQLLLLVMEHLLVVILEAVAKVLC